MKPGISDEWYTPKYFFDAFNVMFDLDPCSPDKQTFVPCLKRYTKQDDGLNQVWSGLVWMNPPFGGRNGHFPWMRKFVGHGNGLGLMTALTSSEGFQTFIPRMTSILFPHKKTKFVRPDGTDNGYPFNGVVVFALGEVADAALKRSNLGIYLKV
jgi:hypothetical protein